MPFRYTEVYFLVGNQILWSSKALWVWWSAWTIQFGFLRRLETTFKLLVTECHWASWYEMHSLFFALIVGNSCIMTCLMKSINREETNYVWLIHPEPIGGEITIALESSWMDKAPQSDMERRLMEQLRESKFTKTAPVQAERRGCYYTSIPASVKHKNVSGVDLTALNLDKVMLLSLAPSNSKSMSSSTLIRSTRWRFDRYFLENMMFLLIMSRPIYIL